ncbi:SprT family zinc-dependent metalloprotease, partial [Clostridium sp. AL.422]|uniref:M48 family metallopeptidase n=1 Tax=Clostridium TaxID=1485 RepID=UPI00293DAAD5
LVKKQKWIISNYNKIMNEHYNTSNKIIFLGKELLLKIVDSNYEKIDIDDEIITIKTKNTDSDNVKLTLSNWYKEQANAIIIKRTNELAYKYSLHPSKILIRNQKTRWGSCNTKKEIRLNWRLILAPPYVIDYIIVHELSHLKHMNHSSDFWKLVENYNKDYKKAEDWLKENGIKIMRIN